MSETEIKRLETMHSGEKLNCDRIMPIVSSPYVMFNYVLNTKIKILKSNYISLDLKQP